MLTVCSPRDASSSTNVTYTASRSRSMRRFMTSLPSTRASRRVVEVKLSFMTTMLEPVACWRISGTRSSSSSSLPLSVARSSSRSEVREDAVGQEQGRLEARDGAAQAGQVMQLAEHPREGGLAALIGAGHHQDALRPLQREVVAHHRCALADELVGQGDVERAERVGLLGFHGHPWIAECQPGRFEPLDIFEVRDVELDLPVEGADRRVEILAVARAEVVERPEDTRVELRDEVQDLGFDVVHVEPVRELGPVVPHGSLLEFREGPLDLLAVV